MANWNLNQFYESDEQWLEDFNKLEAEMVKIKDFEGKLSNYKDFRDFHLLDEDLSKKFYRLYAYAHLASDLNLKDVGKSGLNQKIMMLVATLSQLSSFSTPEILSLGEEVVFDFISRDERLHQHKFPYEKMFRNQEHVLSAPEERIMANFQPVTSLASSLYQALSIVDREDETATLSDGSQVTVSQAQFINLLIDAPTADDRMKIFEAMYRRYDNNSNAFARVYQLVLEGLKARYQSRKYNSSLDSALFGNAIPETVFTNLMEVAYENTDPVKRYINIRKKHLNIETYRTYDRLLPLVVNDKKYPYDEAKEIFLKSLEGFDAEFVKNQERALEDGYVDVHPQDGKRTGAYSSSMYGYHPHILLNHNDSLNSMFTLAHEAGHSAHSMFSNENLPMATARYTIFVAEIASTFNEHALSDYLLKNAKDKNERIEVLQNSIDTILATFYRQTLFATFEYRANQLLEKGIPVTEQSLSQIMIDLYKHYYDIDITEEPGKKYVWAYIPHMFHTPFYVYQYATSYSASLKVYEDVKNGKKGAMENYIKMLKSGGTDYPVDLAKLAGADLTNKDSFLAVVDRLNSLIDELELELK